MESARFFGAGRSTIPIWSRYGIHFDQKSAPSHIVRVFRIAMRKFLALVDATEPRPAEPAGPQSALKLA
jgi:hypothetical protein